MEGEHQQPSGDHALSRPVRWYWIFLSIGLVSTVALMVVYTIRSRALGAEMSEQMKRSAARVASGIEPHLVIAQQLSRTTAALVGPIRNDAGRVHGHLAAVLASAPRDTIFGVGAWFEPHTFSPSQRYFGPYARRSDRPDPPIIVTDEWTSPAYDFHRQGWYLAGKAGLGDTVFTEPYFDTDHVYMSASTGFFDGAGRFAGVVTVDMVLPLIRTIVLGLSGNSRIVYLTTAKGSVFVHPEEDAMLARIRNLEPGRRIKSILDLNAVDLASHEAARGRSQWVVCTHEVGQVGWRVHVAAEPGDFAVPMRSLKTDFLSFGLGLWALVGLAMAMSRRASHRLARANLLHAHLQREIAEKSAREAALKEHKEALEAAVRQRTEELARLNAGKDHLIAILAHDMRGLFGAIMGYSQLLTLSGGDAPKGGKPLAETLNAAVHQAHRLFENLLLWIRLHSDRVAFTREEISLFGAISRGVGMISEHARIRGVEVHVDVAEGLVVLGDANMIETLVRNLASNALKFTPSGGTIRVSAKPSSEPPDSLVVTIEDTGIGMDPDQAARLFHMERISSTPGVDGTKGTGLGLQICFEIVTRLKGTIGVTSAPGKGTTVRVTLPGLPGPGQAPETGTGRP